MSVQHARKEAALFKTVAQIVTEEITNANVSYPTVTGVKLTPDSSHLTVYVVFENNPEKSLEALIQTKGYVKTRVSKMENLRKAPEIHFVLDSSFEEGMKIEKILKEINKK